MHTNETPKFKISEVNANAFKNKQGEINLYTCNAATGGESSIANELATNTKTKVTGAEGRTEYKNINRQMGIVSKFQKIKKEKNMVLQQVVVLICLN